MNIKQGLRVHDSQDVNCSLRYFKDFSEIRYNLSFTFYSKEECEHKQKLLASLHDTALLPTFELKLSIEELKFIYYEKETKFCKISTVDLFYEVPVKSTMEISQNLVDFSEYMNFKFTMFTTCILHYRSSA